MSGETEDHISGWTVDTLKEHLESMAAAYDRRYEQRFEAQEQAVTAALNAAKEAVQKAEVAAEKRFDAVNEFRGQLAEWDVVVALLILLVAVVLSRIVTEIPWVAWTTLFLVGMFGLALTVKF